MAVPKQRQSHSRTNKRRSQHKARGAEPAPCPRCHAPRLPHRVCPSCGTYAGREVVVQAADTARRVARWRGDRARRERGRRRAVGRSPRAPRRSDEEVLLFGPEAAMGEPGARVQIVDAPEKIAGGEEPVRAVRSRPDASIVQAARAVGEGRADGARLRRHHRAHAGGGHPERSSASRASTGRRSPCCSRSPAARCCCSTAAPTWRCAPSTSSSSPTWAPASWRRCWGSSGPRVGLLSVGEEQGKGTPDVLEAGERLDGRLAELRRQRRGLRPHRRHGADVVVTDGFTGNVALKVLEGDLETGPRRDPRRDQGQPAGHRRRPADPRPRRASCATQLDPEEVGGAILLGLRKPVVVAHGSLRPRRHRQRGAAGPARGRRAHGRAHRRSARPRPGSAVRTRC